MRYHSLICLDNDESLNTSNSGTSNYGDDINNVESTIGDSEGHDAMNEEEEDVRENLTTTSNRKYVIIGTTPLSLYIHISKR